MDEFQLLCCTLLILKKVSNNKLKKSNQSSAACHVASMNDSGIFKKWDWLRGDFYLYDGHPGYREHISVRISANCVNIIIIYFFLINMNSAWQRDLQLWRCPQWPISKLCKLCIQHWQKKIKKKRKGKEIASLKPCCPFESDFSN